LRAEFSDLIRVGGTLFWSIASLPGGRKTSPGWTPRSR